MALPFPTPITTGAELDDQEIVEAAARAESQILASELDTFNKYRDWYEGEQKLAFGTEKFKERFGTDNSDFEGFRDNWCEVVVDAVLDKLEIVGLTFPDQEEEGEGTEIEAEIVDASDSLTDRIWGVLEDNDFDEQQLEIHEGALVEGRSAMIVWPDNELGARIDWQPAQTVRVRYSDEDRRRPVLAIRRWETPSGEVRVSVYTPSHVWKFTEATTRQNQAPLQGPFQRVVPDTTPGSGLTPRRVPSEPWPLPHDMGEVPVVEFENKGGSEIKNVIPQQDAVNFLLLAALGMAETSSLPPRGFFSNAKEPTGGWKDGPGQFWQIPIALDADGKPMPASEFQFDPGDLDQMRNLTDSFLMHMAFTSKTPVRYFFQSDRGGRGDAPSGESLLVSDQQLLDKVDRRMTRFGVAWHRVVRLVAKAMDLSGNIPRGTIVWQDPRSEYRSTILEDALMMKELGLPFSYIITTLGLSPTEIRQVMKLREKEQEEKEAKVREDAEFQAELTARTAPPPVTSPSPPAQ